MTKAYSSADDNGGRCEMCNLEESIGKSQTTYPVLLGGGMGWGTMWVCSVCLPITLARDKAEKELKEAKRTGVDVVEKEAAFKEAMDAMPKFKH